MKFDKMHYVSQALIGVAGIATIALAVYVTKSAVPLWGLLLVSFCIPTIKRDSKTIEQEDELEEDGEE